MPCPFWVFRSHWIRRRAAESVSPRSDPLKSNPLTRRMPFQTDSNVRRALRGAYRWIREDTSFSSLSVIISLQTPSLLSDHSFPGRNHKISIVMKGRFSREIRAWHKEEEMADAEMINLKYQNVSSRLSLHLQGVESGFAKVPRITDCNPIATPLRRTRSEGAYRHRIRRTFGGTLLYRENGS